MPVILFINILRFVGGQDYVFLITNALVEMLPYPIGRDEVLLHKP